MKFTHVDHVTVIVTDAAKTRQFYGEWLGLEEVTPPTEFDFPAIWYDLGGFFVHCLVKPVADAPSPRHFCLHVEDCAAARRELTAHGIEITETVIIAAADRFFVKDPDGNRIEILTWRRDYNSLR